MPKVAAFVDGHTEENFLRNNYPPDQIRILRCLPNGSDVALNLVAEVIADKLTTLSVEYTHVMVLYDREDRQQTIHDLAEQLSDLIGPALGPRALVFGFKDVELENWILADHVYLQSLGCNAPVYDKEGQKAKPTLDSYFKESLSHQKKAAMLGACTPSRIAERSSSFQQFAKNCIDLEWWWLGE